MKNRGAHERYFKFTKARENGPVFQKGRLNGSAFPLAVRLGGANGSAYRLRQMVCAGPRGCPEKIACPAAGRINAVGKRGLCYDTA